MSVCLSSLIMRGICGHIFVIIVVILGFNMVLITGFKELGFGVIGSKLGLFSKGQLRGLLGVFSSVLNKVHTRCIISEVWETFCSR